MSTTTAIAIRDPTITALEAYPMGLEEVRRVMLIKAQEGCEKPTFPNRRWKFRATHGKGKNSNN